MKIDIHFLSYLAQFFLEREMLQAKILEKIKTYSIFNNLIFFPKIVLFIWDNVEKYSRDRQAIEEITVHSHCMPGN